VEIDFHRAFGDPELRRDVAVAKPLADELDQFALARGERRCARRSVLRLAGALLDLGVDNRTELAMRAADLLGA
jgi:hypothetical protein